VFTLRVRLRVWIPSENIDAVQSQMLGWRNDLGVDTALPPTGGREPSAWREVQLLGEARGVFDAFALLERRVLEVDDVVLAFPVAKVRCIPTRMPWHN